MKPERTRDPRRGPYNAGVTLLAELVQTSERIAATSARLGKVQTLAAYLRTLDPDEIETAVHFLSGSIPQGRIGIGYALLEDASAAAHATTATLSLQEVNAALAATPVDVARDHPGAFFDAFADRGGLLVVKKR